MQGKSSVQRLGAGLLALGLVQAPATAQHPFRAAMPLDTMADLSGTFAEIRPGHFHSGIDLRTGQATGLPVTAADTGHVSRVKVQAGGFGHAVYVEHPGGLTTVYAHLCRFSDTLQAYVLAAQEASRSFEVNLFPERGRFPAGPATLIGYSGNTGSSQGPHLHFELRDTRSQEPVDPMAHGYSVRDTVPPVITGLRYHAYRTTPRGLWLDTAFTPPAAGKQLALPRGGELAAWSVEISDHMGSPEINLGPREVTLEVDGKTRYRHRVSRFSYSDTRYAMSATDHDTPEPGRTYILLHRLPGNALRRFSPGDGFLSAGDTLPHRARITVSDFSGNRTDTTFTFRHSGPPVGRTPVPEVTVTWDKPFYYMDSLVRLKADGMPLTYRLQAFTVGRDTMAGFPGPVWYIGHRGIPIHRRPRLSLKLPPGVPPDKAVIVSLDRAGTPSALASSHMDGWITARIGAFGTFALLPDTVPPVISYTGDSLDVLAGGAWLVFKVTDSLSGVHTYEVVTDGRWSVAHWDPKAGKLSCEKPAGLRRTVVTVTDRKQNRTVYSVMPD